jgi:hypothetical protein
MHFITYGDAKYESSKERIKSEAIHSGWFDSVTVYGPRDLTKPFKKEFKSILRQPRGGGYWIWKCDIIQQKLAQIADGDILIYMDAGCSINAHGKKRLDEYVQMLNESDAGIISFQMSHAEKKFTTREIFEALGVNVNVDCDIANSGQLIGTILILKKIPCIIELFERLRSIYSSDPLIVTDMYNHNQNAYFEDNRHDQSVLSVLRKLQPSKIILDDETYFESFGFGESLKYPFWATRIRR